MQKIYPILLAGGSGTRLWPLSRKSYPKQFSKLIGDNSLFQQSALRLCHSKILDFAPHITLTNSDFRFIVAEQLSEVGIDPGSILLELEGKNTAPAILAATIYAHAKDPNAIVLAAPSDHFIPNTDDFHDAVKVGLSHVSKGKIVTFGIKPSRPETGYGYLELSTTSLDVNGTSELLNFVEKPNSKEASEMLKSERFFWNAGIFLFRAKDMIAAFEMYAKQTLDLVTHSVDNASTDLGFLRLAEEAWSKVTDISIDYLIMEKVDNLVAVPYKSKWSDLGDWDAVWSEGNIDAFGNVVSVSANAIDCKNTLLRSESESQQVVGIGLENIIAVSMTDAVLIADKRYSQDVKKAVAQLRSQNIVQADVFPKDHRPWGWFESLTLGNRFQVKRICVKPGAALSLQSHRHRSEHWIVVEGTAKVTVDNDTKLITEGQSIYVPLGAVHRLENSGRIPMVLIEVQIGSYLGEDDIIRYEDVYARVQQ